MADPSIPKSPPPAEQPRNLRREQRKKIGWTGQTPPIEDDFA